MCIKLPSILLVLYSVSPLSGDSASVFSCHTTSAVPYQSSAQPSQLLSSMRLTVITKSSHPRKASLPIFKTLSGKTISLSAVQPEKASAPISRSPSCRIIFSSDSQPRNAPLPIWVTVSGISTSVSPLHPEKAPSPMLISPSRR